MSKLKDKVDAAAKTQALAKPTTTVLGLFKDPAFQQQMKRRLPSGVFDPERLLAVVMNEVGRNPRLLECTRDSFAGALLLSAQLGLEVGGPLGHFYLVPFKNTKRNTLEVTPILGYKGMIVLARRSGEVSDVIARPVYEHDQFEFAYGIEDKLVHVPAEGDRGKVVRFYGVARYTNGGHLLVVMTKAEVDRFRDRSRAKDDGPWKTDYEAMGAKTVIRRMAAFMPLTTESATAIAEDEERELGTAPEVIDVSSLAESTPAPSDTVATESANVETAPQDEQAMNSSADQPAAVDEKPLSEDPGAAFRRKPPVAP